jgi:hypothetical protein
LPDIDRYTGCCPARRETDRAYRLFTLRAARIVIAALRAVEDHAIDATS